MIKTGDTYQEEFSFSQADVQAFANVSGDHNPIHLDEEVAAQTVYKRPILHGMLGASVFSRIIGMTFPGQGTVYLNQTLQFKRPMYPDEQYRAEMVVLEVEERRKRARIETKLVQVVDGKPVLVGEAYVMNKEKL